MTVDETPLAQEFCNVFVLRNTVPPGTGNNSKEIWVDEPVCEARDLWWVSSGGSEVSKFPSRNLAQFPRARLS